MEATLLVTLIAVFLLAGTVKGLVGLGMPTTALGLMAQFVEPRQAIAYLMMSMLISNCWQVYQSGDFTRALIQYSPFGIVLILALAVTFFATVDFSDSALLGTLAIVILLFIAVSAIGWAPRIPSTFDYHAQVVAGGAAGFIGGLTAVWAPPMALYLLARDAKKDEFVRVSGLLIALGSVPLLLGYLWFGFLNASNFYISLMLVVPALIGFSIGERLRGYVSETRFRKILLFVFFLLALNLLRRAISGS